jgi:hypothetical protein
MIAGRSAKTTDFLRIFARMGSAGIEAAIAGHLQTRAPLE